MGVGALLTLGGSTVRGKSYGYLTPGEVRDEEEVAAVEARPPRALLHAVRAAPQGSAPTAGGSDPNACSGGAATISPTCVCVCAELQGAEPAVTTPSCVLAAVQQDRSTAITSRAVPAPCWLLHSCSAHLSQGHPATIMRPLPGILQHSSLHGGAAAAAYHRLHSRALQSNPPPSTHFVSLWLPALLPSTAPVPALMLLSVPAALAAAGAFLPALMPP